jgi:hypothetical protein
VRLLTLHARGRRAGPIAFGLLGVAAVSWALASLVDGTEVLVTVLGPLAMVSLLGFTLAGDDPELERTTPQHWPRWRAAELTACAIAAVVALLPTLLEADRQAGATLRNLAGLGGLTALGAVVVGARLAWLAPSVSVFTAAAIGSSSDLWLAAVTWPIQAGDAGGALALAAVLALGGTSIHTRNGARTTIPAIQ